MWWIAACLGALVWLLAVRIRIKEKDRRALRLERSKQIEKASRGDFLDGVFSTAAREYLAQTPQFETLLLVFAHLDWPDKPSEVHMEIVPVTDATGTWPEWANSCPWVTHTEQGIGFEPPEAHWQRLGALDAGLSKLACFADVAPPRPGATATLTDYRLYAVARRGADDVEIDVVGEPN